MDESAAISCVEFTPCSCLMGDSAGRHSLPEMFCTHSGLLTMTAGTCSDNSNNAPSLNSSSALSGKTIVCDCPGSRTTLSGTSKPEGVMPPEEPLLTSIESLPAEDDKTVLPSASM